MCISDFTYNWSLTSDKTKIKTQALKLRLETRTNAQIHVMFFATSSSFILKKKKNHVISVCVCFKWRDINLSLEPGEESDYFFSGAISSVIVIHSVNSIWPLQKHFPTSM